MTIPQLQDQLPDVPTGRIVAELEKARKTAKAPEAASCTYKASGVYSAVILPELAARVVACTDKQGKLKGVLDETGQRVVFARWVAPPLAVRYVTAAAEAEREAAIAAAVIAACRT